MSQSAFKFDLKARVKMVHSDEVGEVVSRSDHVNSENQYYIIYKSSTGRQVTNWWDESHPDPEALWEVGDAPPRYNAKWEAEDGGRQLVAQVDLPAVASGTQVQRLNRLRWGRGQARLAQRDAVPFWEAWEAEGWFSLGREKNFDWMHVQAVAP